MRTALLLLAMALLAGCYEDRTVKIVQIVPRSERGSGWTYSCTYKHVMVDDVNTGSRYRLLGTWGNTGDVFTVSSRILHQ